MPGLEGSHSHRYNLSFDKQNTTIAHYHDCHPRYEDDLSRLDVCNLVASDSDSDSSASTRRSTSSSFFNLAASTSPASSRRLSSYALAVI